MYLAEPKSSGKQVIRDKAVVSMETPSTLCKFDKLKNQISSLNVFIRNRILKESLTQIHLEQM